MLFSIPEPGWWVIAIAATAFFMLGIRALPAGLDIPDDVRAEWAGRSGRGKRAFYVRTPLVAAGVLATSLLRPGPSSPMLFLFSVAFAAIPIAIFPVRGRMLRAYLAQRERPDTGEQPDAREQPATREKSGTREQQPNAKDKPDRLAVAWIVAVLSVAILAAVLALMSSPYGSPA
ncbi:hypothetical protein amrb99_67590 [Actinomadura sp. RB99]|uniref:hypothetical protein n=1 Tax=Actinomadura sp. RB99 TaxID=2691577 RepID=UPI0016894A71|nr:hypothetical protein [Actinomadura sp. RB99]MBD2897795.1 hypothetical protein [Actinomadura sp. RB99]